MATHDCFLLQKNEPFQRNEALKVYEEIHNDHPDTIDCLRGLVQIKKELGMPYQSYSEKLMVLDREEEAKRMMNGG